MDESCISYENYFMANDIRERTCTMILKIWKGNGCGLFKGTTLAFN